MTEEEMKEMLAKIVDEAVTAKLEGAKPKEKFEEVPIKPIVTENSEEMKKQLKELEDRIKEINNKEKETVINTLVESYGISKDELPSTMDVNDIKKLESVLKKTRELKEEEKNSMLTQEKIIDILSKDESLKNAVKLELSKNTGVDPSGKKLSNFVEIIQSIAGKKI